MKNIVNKFNSFARTTEEMARNPKTLTVAFIMAAVTFPFSHEIAVGSAVAPTLLAGGSLMAKGTSKAVQSFSRNT